MRQFALRLTVLSLASAHGFCIGHRASCSPLSGAPLIISIDLLHPAIALYNSLLVASVPKRAIDFLTIMMWWGILALSLRHWSHRCIESLAPFPLCFNFLYWLSLFCHYWYISFCNVFWCRNTSIRRCYGIQLLDLSISIVRVKNRWGRGKNLCTKCST